MKTRTTLYALATLPFALLLAPITGAKDAPLWLRYPAISPSGASIVFAYRGDLYKVPAGGGDAVHLTQHEAHDYKPVWSGDSKFIAFASERHGNFDLFVISAAGGPAQRLTFHSADDYPSAFSADGKRVIFSSVRIDGVKAIGFPTRALPELYSVPVKGGRVKQVLTTPAEDAVYDTEGMRIAYHDRKGYESAWRKHHQSSVARDIWVYDVKAKNHRQVTDFSGEDRNPVWDGDTLFYLSEQGGTFNVWKTTLAEDAKPETVTTFEKHPVRFLSRADNGTLCFSFHGEIYTLKAGGKPKKVAVRIAPGEKANPRAVKRVGGGVTDMALSPGGKEVAFVVRGEIFVTSLEHGATKRITHTPEQERSVSFHPDGRSLLYAGERNGSWNLYQARLARENEKVFYLSTLIEESAVVETGKETFQPAYSPDGKEVAFLENRTTLRVINLETKEVRTVLPGDQNYSYEDGDQAFDWSPDGHWLLSGMLGNGRWSEDIALVPASGEGEVVNLTQSGYPEWTPSWVLGGKGMIFTSNRHGKRAHGSWGSHDDVYGMFFTQDAYDKFRLSKEEYELLKEEKDEKKKDEKEEKKEDEEKKDEGPKLADPVELDLEGIENRLVRLTIHSSDIGGAVLSTEGDKLFYLSKFEEGYDLWVHKFYEEETKLLTKFSKEGGSRRDDPARELLFSADGKKLIVLSSGSIFTVDPEKGEKKKVEISAEMTVDYAAERAYIYEHAWRQAREKFYVEDLHGVDWDFYKKAYATFLPHINNNHDFAELLSELLGELNASHTGGYFYPRSDGGDETARLGLFYDPKHNGPGLKILEVMDKSPVIKADSKIKAGVVIEKIDGELLKANESPYPLLNRKAGKRVLLSLNNPVTGDLWDEVVKPVDGGGEQALVFKRWKKRNRELVDKLSEGRIGYVHVRSMNDSSFRETFNDVLGRLYKRDALIVDTRFNGGGWLHDDLATFLNGKDYLQFYPRKQGNLGGEPHSKWSKPSIVVMGEGNYSDAHMFPYTYKALGVGKLLGAPVPGTATAVWWEKQIDSSIVFGIPQVGMLTPEGDYLENTQLEPDIKVLNRPGDVAKGKDRQLERAVKELLKQVGAGE